MSNLILYTNALFTIAYRDFVKFIRDRQRIIATFIFPFVFVGIVGTSFQSNVGEASGINFILLTFTGVLAQTLFQSSANGIISLVEDRQEDFAQELFITPLPRVVIILGKILGESAVAMVQGLGIIVFGIVSGVNMTPAQVLSLLPIFLVITLFGAAFGVLVMSNLKDQKAANQIFPLLILPQFFLAGVFGPINNLPPVLLVLSRIAPMTYAVDFLRGMFFAFGGEKGGIVLLNSPLVNLLIISLMFIGFLSVGTFIFVRNEKNK